MVRMNLQCTPTLWVSFFSLPCMLSSQHTPLLCSQGLPQPSLSCSTQPCWQHALAVRDRAGLWSPSKLFPGARLCDCAGTLLLPSEMTFLRSPGCVQGGHAHASREGSGIAVGAQEGKVLLNSPSREEMLSPTPCLHVPCRDSIPPSLRFCVFFSSTPENLGFFFPHFLLLKETFNPTRLLDRAWQNFEDLLKIGDNEQKQEEWLWR